MVNLRIVNSETVSLNVHYHVAELQLIPREVYEHRTNGAESTGLAVGPDTEFAHYSSASSRACHPGGGHKNYVMWRNLRGR
jgi:hypothetical protein